MTIRNYSTKAAAVAGAVGLLAMTGQVSAQSSDALIDKLVSKGILTVKEGNELREESDKNFTSAFAVKTGMPDWISGYKFSGDFRGRFEMFSGDNNAAIDRDRYRYRLRAGVVITMKDDLEVGFRLDSGDPSPGSGYGGNPNSASSTFQDNFTRKFVYIDAAYGKWTPLHNADWTLATTIGKMDNPFRVSNMVFDYDLDPEGAALQAAYQINNVHSLSFNSAAFVLDEEKCSTRDPAMFGAQLIWDAKWTPKVETSLGVSAFNIVNSGMLTTANVPYVNQGNTRNSFGVLVNNYNPVVLGGSVIYKLDSFPFYPGIFPIKIGGEYMDNPAAGSNNTGYRGGITFGKSGTKKTWDISYRYQELQANAWYDQMEDDDNCAFYRTAPSGGAVGYLGGTNIKGHLIIANYSFTDSMSFTFTCYLNELIGNSSNGTSEPQSKTIHMMADVNWKF
jgi:hypothetical protein